MNIVICGAGEVGRHAAEVLGACGHSVTVIDLSADKLSALDEVLDMRHLQGSATHAKTLIEAGCADADLFIAATNIDEINLLSASIAGGVGADRTIARVHHSAYFDNQGMDYAQQLGIDHLVCPEYTTAVAIAQTLRSPGALAVERFARGSIELQRLVVSEGAPFIGKRFYEISLPNSTRVALVDRDDKPFIPDGHTSVSANDIVTLIGHPEGNDVARKQFHIGTNGRRRVMIVGGTAMGVWLCRALKSRDYSVRLFESDRERAEELAEKLDWVTVLHGDFIDTDILSDERLDQCNAFVALTNDDEHNILLAARAKSMGASNVIAVQQRSTYLHLLGHVGVDKAFSPRATAVGQIQSLLQAGPFCKLTSLAENVAEVYEIRVTERSDSVTGKPLKDVKFPAGSMVAAVQRETEVFVPGGSDMLQQGDTVIIIGPADAEKKLKKTFGVK